MLARLVLGLLGLVACFALVCFVLFFFTSDFPFLVGLLALLGLTMFASHSLAFLESARLCLFWQAQALARSRPLTILVLSCKFL